jgi:hypothetical protein
MTEDEKLSLLKTILLTDEREYADSISKKINALEETLRERHKLSEKISPIIQSELLEFSERIPETLGPVITETLRVQIANSKDQVVEALYPILGMMVKKFIANEIKILSEKIEQSTKDAFSMQSLKRKLFSSFTGVKENELVLNELANAQIEQVFIIEKSSGILLGSYSKKETVDEDMLSGMLTAIKAFVEDAFKGETQNLTGIEYDLYEIHLQNLHTYYIATAVSGTFTESHENELERFNYEVSEKINKRGLLTNKKELEKLLMKNYELMNLYKTN